MRLRRTKLALPLLLAPLAGGCRLLSAVAETPAKVASAALPGGKTEPRVSPDTIAVRLMRFADVFAAEIRLATREFAERGGTPEARAQALSWRVDYTSGAYRLATGPRPYGGAFDTIVLVTALRSAHEEKWLAEWGEADRPMVESLKRLEEGAWALAAEALTEEQLAQVRQIVQAWLQRDPEGRVVDIARLPGFVEVAGTGAESGHSLVGELTELVKLDPLSGLDPAVRQLEQSRQLGERLFFYAQRLPDLLAARVELLALRSAQAPEVTETLASWQRVSEAAASIAATAEALPADLAAEREAALAQISRELTAQRAGLVRDLETAREPAVELLASARETADAGRTMSEALTETVRALDEFMARFDEGAEEPAAGAPGAEPASGAAAAAEPAARPFDIAEYGAAAERIGAASRELRETIATLDRSLPEVQRVLDEAATRAERGVDHAFARALQLLGIALAGGAVAVLVVRRVSLRWRSPGAG